MPKIRKQNKRVKKKNNRNTRKKRTNRNIKIPVVPLLELTTETEPGGNNTITEPGIGSKIKVEDLVDVSEQKAGIISIVRDLEGQVDTAYELKKVLEAELDATRKKLSEESAVRAQLERRIKSAEEQFSLIEQLRQDISFAEQERNRFDDLLARTRQQLKVMTGERDSLAEQTAIAETHIKELNSDKTVLEARLMNLKDRVSDMERMGAELADARAEIENLRDKVADAENRAADLHTHLQQQQAMNNDLREIKEYLEKEIKASNAEYKIARNELDSFKKAICDIRSEATETNGRIRHRYLRPGKAAKLRSKPNR
ncbi:MAG TPA: hypothetical protein HPP87_03105 [Planctomycetes bacterium]|nr:hypothetical protein [Planctomycetota bacterium]HIJ70334.1 hypothetical protein [Planctomycetota bacterium]